MKLSVAAAFLSKKCAPIKRQPPNQENKDGQFNDYRRRFRF